jgi:DNA gyrase subunit A
VLLTTAAGRAIRFPVSDVRVFAGRDSTGVRGIKLLDDDLVISMAILRSVDATPEERAAYLKQARAALRAMGEEAEDADAPVEADDEAVAEAQISPERYAALGAAEETILTLSSEGIGKRSSAYDFRRTGRGGQGLMAQDLSRKGGRLVAAFPVEQGDQLLLVTDAGQLIRVPVGGIRIAARNTQGVIVFRTGEGEHVVSVERLAEAAGEDHADEDAADEDGADEDGAADGEPGA